MHLTVKTPGEFQQHWAGVHNFMLEGACKPFGFDFPPLERLVDVLRRDPEVNVMEGLVHIGKNPRIGITEAFRDRPLSEALHGRFILRHMNILKFDRPDGLLEGFSLRVIRPLYEMLMAGGFTWSRCVPYMFCSGPGCNSSLHADLSHVIAWQVYGNKKFVGFNDPPRWLTRDMRRDQVLAPDPGGYDPPGQATDDDRLVYDMQPGDALWNAFHTLHVVTGGDGPSLSVNISLGGLRHHGRLCQHEQDMVDFLDEKARSADSTTAAAY